MIGITADVRLNDKVVSRLKDMAYRDGVVVGYSGEGKTDEGIGLSTIAKIHEFGTKNIPPRPFIRPTLDEHKKDWADAVVKGLKRSESEAGIIHSWENVGNEIVKELKEAIDRVDTPPLSARTIAHRLKRGNTSDKPLYDTGKMRNELGYKVSHGEWKK